jgi:tyrosine-specific transport protein
MSVSSFSWGSVSRILTAALLVAGTCIGGGMLALPVTAAQGGFVPALCYMVVVWLMMTITALSLVEIGFWMDKSDAHIITMASVILGRWGRVFIWILFLFISYASLVAYTGGGGHFIAVGLSSVFGFPVSREVGCCLFIMTFGLILLGPRIFLGRANNALFLLMIIAYVVLIYKGIDDIDLQLLFQKNWTKATLAVPMLVTAFSFQTMVPSLHPFLQHQRSALRMAVILGTTIAFVVYGLWLLVIFGSVPLEGEWGLLRALQLGTPATHCLIEHTQCQVIAQAAAFFSLFALITSFFGIGMGLVDFLADGLNIRKKGKGVLTLGAIVLVPSLFFAIAYERIFITALDISGGFGDTILNGIVPLVMLWIGSARFWKMTKKQHAIFGSTLCCLLILYLAVVYFEANITFFGAHLN